MQTLVAVEPQIQTWPLVEAQAQATSQEAAKAIWIRIVPVMVQPSGTYVASLIPGILSSSVVAEARDIIPY